MTHSMRRKHIMPRACRIVFFWAALFAACANTPGIHAQAMRPLTVREAKARLQKTLKAWEETGVFPGVTVAFVLENGGSGSLSAGLSDSESKRKMRPDDRMLAGSIGKTFVAAVALRLVEEGRLDLDTRIDYWLGKQAWFSRLPNAEDITLRMLMNHTSGIPEHVLNPAFTKALFENPDRVWKPEELLTYILDARPLFPAGKGWSYADTNYILVGIIVEQVTQHSLYSEIDRRLIQPLRLEHTAPSISRVLPGLVMGYSQPNSPFGFSGRVLKDKQFILNPQFEWAGGGFVSTSGDLAHWAKDLYGGNILKPATKALMLTGVAAKTGRGDQYGLGVQIRQTAWGLSVGHGGWFPGYLSEMEYFPEHKVALALQFNTDDVRKLGRLPHAYLLELAQALFTDAPVRAPRR